MKFTFKTFFVITLNISILILQSLPIKGQNTPKLEASALQIIQANSIAISSDGKFAVTVIGDSTLKILDLLSGLEINNYSYNIKEIRHVQFSPNDKLILSTCWDGITEIFDISSNKNALTLPKDTLGAHFSTLSSDGKLGVRCNMNNSLELYEISSGKVIQIFDGHQNTITSMALSPDGEMLLTSSFDETVRLFNVSSGLKLLEIPIENFDGNEVAVFSSNGKSILIGEGEFDSNNFRWKWYSPFQLYNLTTGKKIGTNASYIYGASFSSNSTFLISYGNNNSACVYDILSSNEIQCFSYPNLIISSVELSHDGNLALIGYENGMTKTFDVSSGKEIQIIKNK